jgi:5-hydroxyisourate hydrolase
MATISSHTLNSVDGSHAAGIAVALYRIGSSDARELVFETATDDGGRLSETLAADAVDSCAQYEMVLQAGAYFAARAPEKEGRQIVREVVIRFAMPDPEARYHIPLILAPHSYAVWWSS